MNCTGPFAFGSWTPGKQIVLKRFDGYWDPALKAKAASVKFVFLQDPNTRINALQSGEVDGGWQVPSNAYAQLKNGGPGKLYYGTNTTVVDEIVSNLKGPARRQAGPPGAAHGDRPRGHHQGRRAGSGRARRVPRHPQRLGRRAGHPTSTPSTSLPQYPHDVDKAKALAAAAGVNGQKVVIATSPITSARRHHPGRRAGGDRIGLKPKIETISPDKYTTLFSDPAARKGIDLFITSWYVSIGDPLDMYGILRTGEFSNYGGWSNPDSTRQSRRPSGRPTRRSGRRTPRRRSRSPRTSCPGCRCTRSRRRCG